jgi:hypothetical protein
VTRLLPFLIAAWLISIPAARAQLVPGGQSAPINISSATTTQLVAASGSTRIFVTAWVAFANAASNFSLEYGATIGGPCGVGATPLTGAYDFAAQSGISAAGGALPLYVVPAGYSLCAVTSGPSVSVAGSLSYIQY